MAFDEYLAERIRELFARRDDIEEKKMFGGIGFMLSGNLCVGVWKESLVARIGPETADAWSDDPHVEQFAPAGKPMKGWLLVGPEAIEESKELQAWIRRAVDFVETLPPKR
jgi:TfoX/Sxy family transcriptional regulator of competence genes